MLRLVLVRLAYAVPVLLLVAAVAFVLGNVAGDPLSAAVGIDATQAQRAAAAAALGLDGPLPARFLHFLERAASGDFGISVRLGRPVGPLLLERMPATLELAACSFALALLVGVPVGILAGLRPRSLLARLLMALSLLGVSLPTFLTGTLLLLIFSVMLHVLPSFGRGETVDLGGWTTGLLTPSGRRALVLPAVTLAVFQTALLMRLLRAGLMAAMASDHVRFARARGLSRCAVLRQALRNAAAPLFAAASMQLGMLIAFSIVTETVFQWPGLGLLLVQSITSADVPVMTAYLVVTAAGFAVLNLLADVFAASIDPRLRPEARGGLA
jgi:peptide/nickel transport system permease protein